MIIISIILGAVFIAQLWYFENIEPLFWGSFWGKTILVTFVGLIFFALFNYKKSINKKEGKTKIINSRKLSFIFLFLFLITICASFIINANKSFLDWDSLALYDARAKFLEYGISFSKMSTFANYDNLNKYYYSLYPPFTSIIHFFLHKYYPGVNISFYYSINLVLLGSVVYLFVKKNLGLTFAAFASFVTVAYKDIFVLSTMQYTNIPFALFVIIGIFLLYEYLINDNKQNLYFGSFFVAASIWIRFLEPIWIAVFISFFTGLIVKRGFKNSIVDSLILAIPSLITFESWQFFSATVSHAPGTVMFNGLTIVEPLIGVFTGSLLSLLILFGKWFFAQLTISLAAILSVKKLKAHLIFLATFIITTILIYFSGLYFVSFQSTWWNVLGDSLERSSIFLIPISLFLMLNRLNEFLLMSSKLKKFLKKDNGTGI